MISRISIRYLIKHPWQSILMVIGIMLGVAVVISIDLANSSAGRAFRLSTEAVTGKATHRIIGNPEGIDEKTYSNLRIDFSSVPLAPVIVDYVTSPQLGNIPFQLFGVDPLCRRTV